MSDPIFTDDVTDILDLVYARDGHEPDWAAVRTRLYLMTDSHYSVIINLLRAVWAIYESEGSYNALLYKLQHGD